KLSRVRLIGSTAMLLSVGLLPIAAYAQAQTDNTSVADAARRAREQKKNAAKPARTLTNDDLPPSSEPERPSAAPAAKSSEAAEATERAGAADSQAPAEPTDKAAKKRPQTGAALQRAKAELAQAQSELDVLQRKAALDSDAYYSKTDYARD